MTGLSAAVLTGLLSHLSVMFAPLIALVFTHTHTLTHPLLVSLIPLLPHIHPHSLSLLTHMFALLSCTLTRLLLLIHPHTCKHIQIHIQAHTFRQTLTLPYAHNPTHNPTHIPAHILAHLTLALFLPLFPLRQETPTKTIHFDIYGHPCTPPLSLLFAHIQHPTDAQNPASSHAHIHTHSVIDSCASSNAVALPLIQIPHVHTNPGPGINGVVGREMV